ncbi:hypothetical protein WJX73_009167 [Symbiochloris irregularis]|uniref:HMG domain-containing protein n=1 Tax=Symbiochloris irregularis TaxID=706552 RepID=A0AAW1PHC2_9CHLO
MASDRPELDKYLCSEHAVTTESQEAQALGHAKVQFADRTVVVSWCHNSCSASTGLGSIYQDTHYMWAGAELKDWGLLDHKNLAARCRTGCRPQQGCTHVHKWRASLRETEGEEQPASAAGRSAMLPDEQWEVELSAFLDSATRMQCLSKACISRQPIPELRDRKPEVMAALSGQITGENLLPPVFHPDHEGIACQHCGGTAWSGPMPEVETGCMVFYLHRTATITFMQRKCQTPGCLGRLSADGCELAVLRSSQRYAFSYQVLYHWGDWMASGGVTWAGFWEKQMFRYGQLDIPGSTLNSWYNHRKLFQTACMDFLVLQCLDYDRVICCQCPQPDLAGLMVDGLAMGHALRRANATVSWGPEPNTPATSGSLFTDRVGIADSALRTTVLHFADRGMASTEHQALLTKFRRLDRMRNDLEHALIPFLDMTIAQGSDVLLQPCARKLIYCLATDAPQFLRPHLTSSTPSPAVRNLARTLLLRGRAAFRPASVQAAEVTPRSSAGDLRRQPAEHTRVPSQQRPPSEWKRDEAYLRTGSFKGMGAQTWRPSSLGGSDIQRRLGKYVADKHTLNTQRSCSKSQNITGALVPGCMFYWCTGCRLCVCFHLMADAESPKTVFDTLFTKWQTAPKTFCMDNGCNVHQYILNREPDFFKDMKVFIDQMHYNGHTACSPAYSTGSYEWFTNSPLAEQKNAILGMMQTQAAHMNQTTFLVYLRYAIYRLNQRQMDRNASLDSRGRA